MNLKEFSKRNRRRCESPDGFNSSLDKWSPTDWTNAIAGEVGEACNITKKLLRLTSGARGNKASEQDPERLRALAAEELAEVLIYTDLAIQSLGFDTSDVLEFVFNRKSKQIGYEPSSGDAAHDRYMRNRTDPQKDD